MPYKTSGFLKYDFRPSRSNFVDKAFCDIYIDFGFMEYISDQTTVDTSSKNNFYKQPSSLSKHKEGWYTLNKNNFKGNLGMTLNINYNILSELVMSLNKYQPFLFKNANNYVPLNKEDETYTRVEAEAYLNNKAAEVTIKGIKPDSKYIDLINTSNENVKSKLALSNAVEILFENKLHKLYQP